MLDHRYAFTRFNDRLGLRIKHYFTVETISQSKLFASDNKFTVRTIPNEDTASSRPNDDFTICTFVDHTLSYILMHVKSAIFTISNVEIRVWLEGPRVFKSKRIFQVGKHKIGSINFRSFVKTVILFRSFYLGLDYNFFLNSWFGLGDDCLRHRLSLRSFLGFTPISFHLC
jgi:hypothetical protein